MSTVNYATCNSDKLKHKEQLRWVASCAVFGKLSENAPPISPHMVISYKMEKYHIIPNRPYWCKCAGWMNISTVYTVYTLCSHPATTANTVSPLTKLSFLGLKLRSLISEISTHFNSSLLYVNVCVSMWSGEALELTGLHQIPCWLRS